MTNNLVFKPQDLPKKFTMQERRLGGKKINYNFVSRVKWKSFDWNINQIFLVNTHSRLHYLACHSPTKIQQRYKKVYTLFMNNHFGSHKASIRYLNNWSCHSWM